MSRLPQRLASITLAALLSAASVVFSQIPPVVRAARLSSSIHVDGVVDQAWEDIPSGGSLTQAEPLENQPASESTEFKVAFDDRALYVLVICHDADARHVIATQLQRDAALDVDDRIIVVVDPLASGRNGYFFEVNPAGARADGQISNNAEHRSYDWDGIWNAGARVTADGWVAELEIPFKTLRASGVDGRMGLNVERQIKRRNEIDRWANPRRDIWISNVSRAGTIEGLGTADTGHGTELRPYVAGRQGTTVDRPVGTGVDVQQALSPTLGGSLTLNTDFAETEVDARRINLTRFPLFFPEKRAFFLEGIGAFDIAALGTSNEELVPFFTRRIGLLEGREVPILAGGKLTGSAGPYTLGIVDVQTRDLEDNPLTGQNLLAARATRTFFKQSWIGGLVTHGDPTGTGSNTLVGGDARLATSEFRGGQNLSLDVYLFRTTWNDARGTGYAGGLRIDYPNDLWDIVGSWKQIDPNFDPALGFVARRGIRKGSANISFMPRPKNSWIRQFFFELSPTYVTTIGNRLQNWSVFAAPFNIETESGEHLEWNFVEEAEQLDAPFEIQPGVIIPAGAYRWTRYSSIAETASKRAVVIGTEYEWGGFYGGSMRMFGLGVTFKPSRHFSIATNLDQNDVDLPQGRFTTRVMDLRFDWNASPNVSWANLVQYDNESRLLGVQSRFRWILRAGNDLFLTINRGWERALSDQFSPRFDRESIKLQYTFRL